MSDTVKIAIVIASAVIGSSSAIAGPVWRAMHDRWIEPIHRDSAAVPAKPFFREMERDGK